MSESEQVQDFITQLDEGLRGLGELLYKNEPNRELVEQYLGALIFQKKKVEEWLDQTCGAHPTLVALHKDGFDLPECEGGYSFAEDPETELAQNIHGNWMLLIEARYEHHDDRGGQFTKSLELEVRDGRLYDNTDFLASADDLKACKDAVSEALFTDGG